jgi:S-adenosylmethionine:tRNA-ribosyltransferase-isomerase (queuine synthetase)
MIENNYPFGSSIVEDIKEGDLVHWNDWKVINKKLTKKKKFGVFLKKKSNS